MEVKEFLEQKERAQIFFESVSNHKFNGKYEFNNLDLRWVDHEVKIHCPIHGEITITPIDHLEFGCHLCRDEQINKGETLCHC